MNTQTNNPIVIACATNNHYAMPLGITLYSLVANAKPGTSFVIYLIDSSLTDDNLVRLRRVVQAPGIDIDWNIARSETSELSALPTSGHITTEAYLRFLLADVVSEQFDKVLYLDCDLCVCVALDELWNIDLEDRSLLAGIDSTIRVVSSEYGLRNYRSLGLAADHPYFNSGVLLINLSKWRKTAAKSALIEYAVRNKETLQLHDQGTLNAVFARDWGLLEYKWNADLNWSRYYRTWPDSSFKQQMENHLNEYIASPAIIHYAGRFKPWLPGYKIPHLNTWGAYLWKSGWYTRAERVRWFTSFYIRHYQLLVSRRVFRRGSVN